MYCDKDPGEGNLDSLSSPLPCAFRLEYIRAPAHQRSLASDLLTAGWNEMQVESIMNRDFYDYIKMVLKNRECMAQKPRTSLYFPGACEILSDLP